MKHVAKVAAIAAVGLLAIAACGAGGGGEGGTGGTPPSAPPTASPSTAPTTVIAPEDRDGPVGAANAGWAVQTAFASSDYAKVDSLIESMCTSKERLDDGRSKLSGVTPSLESLFKAYADWDMMFGKLREWRRQTPNSAAADVVESILWRTWAWAARGSGYANTVTPEGWRLFHERLQKAADVLVRTRKNAGTCAWYYEEFLQVSLGLDWDDAAKAALFEAAVQQYPDYRPIYYQRVLQLSPRWGGSYAAVDNFVNSMVQRNPGKQGEALYTLLYWSLDQTEGIEFELFQDSRASWPRMRKGFERLMEQYPHSSWNLNNFAAYACRAGDTRTYQTLRARLEKPYYALAWPPNYSMEVCDARLMKPI